MELVTTYTGKMYKAKVAVRVIERHYENEGEPPYIKYICPVCAEAGVLHQLEHRTNSCPICGVNLDW